MEKRPRRSLTRAAAGICAGVLAVTGLAAFATSASAAQNFLFTRLQGPDRYGTAAVIATQTFTTADTVLIANGEEGHFPDALAGNYLAGVTKSPILLTTPNTLPQYTINALTILKPTKAIILGGTSAVSATVASQLSGMGIGSVTRVGGLTRYDTAMMIAEQPGASGVGTTSGKGATAILANGANFPDALTAGPLSFADTFPIVLTDPTVNGLSPQAQQTLTDLGIKNVLIAGGTAAVTPAAQTALGSGVSSQRLAGNTRQDTAVAIANYETANAGFGNTHINLARGDTFPDALAGGPHAGAELAPILLTNNPNDLGTPADSYLKAHSDTLTSGHIFGGTAAVSDAVDAQATADAKGTAAATAAVTNAGGTVAAGQPINFTITPTNGKTISSVAVTGPCVTGATSSTDTDTTTAGFQGSISANGNAAAGSCTLQFVVTFSDGTTTTLTAPVTVTAPTSNQTLAVSPTTAATQNVGTVRQYTVSGLDNTKAFNVALFNCNNASTDTNGTVTFPNSSNPGGAGNVAQAGTVTGNTITVVNGAAVTTPGSTATNVTPTSGTISFTVQNTATASCVVPVVFQDVNSNGTLDLGTNNQPTEPFGVGGQTNFIVAAPAGSFKGGGGATVPGTNNPVTGVSATMFTQNALTYSFGAADQYQLVTGTAGAQTCTSTTFADFQQRLTVGDAVGGNFQPTGVSTFCLNDVTPAAPTTVSAAQSATAGGVTVTFNPSTTTGVTQYNIYRAPTTNTGVVGAPNLCPAVPGTPGVSPQVAPSTGSTYVKIGTVASTATMTGGNFTFNDTTPAPASGTVPSYCYAVSAVGPNAAGTTQEGTGRAATTNATAATTGGGLTAGNQGIQPAPAPAAGGAPSFAGLTQTNATTFVATYNVTINPATCDTGDFTASYTNPATVGNQALSVMNVSCSSSAATLIFAPMVPAGSTVFVTSQTGIDTNTVCAGTATTNCQVVGQTVQNATPTT